MAIRRDLIAYANVPLVESIDTGLDLSGYRGTLQVRLYPGAAGEALIDLGASHHEMEGVSVEPAGEVTIRIDEDTLADDYDTLIATSQREAGDAIDLSYDLVLTPLLGDEIVHFYGTFELRAGVTRSMAPVPRFGVLGHSFAQRNHSAASDGTYIQTLGYGEVVAAQALNPRFEFIIWSDTAATNDWQGANLGKSGDTSTLALARLPALVALDLDVWLFDCLINDVRLAVSSGTTMANLATVYAAAVANNKPLIVANASPVAVGAEGGGTWGLADPKRAALIALNALVAAYVDANDGIYLQDRWTAYDDGTGVPKADYMEDGLHPSRHGAFAAGGPSLNAALDQIIDDKASAVPTGVNLYSGGDMTGTGGTAGAGVTGTIASNWAAANATGGGDATAVGSQALGHQRFVITCPSTGEDGEVLQVSRAFGSIVVTPGDWFQTWAIVRLSASPIWRQLAMGASVAFALDFGGPYDAKNSLAIEEETLLTIISPPFEIQPGTTSVAPALQIVVDGKADDTGTVDIIQLGGAVVTDPRPSYGF